jgi:hypothetical protein
MLQNGCLSSGNLNEETGDSLTYYYTLLPGIHIVFLMLFTFLACYGSPTGVLLVAVRRIWKC